MILIDHKTARWLMRMEMWMDDVAEDVAAGREAFDSSRRLRRSLSYSAGGVGEYARHLIGRGVAADEEFGTLPWPWHRMAGLRNHFNHSDILEPALLWHAAAVEVPLNRAALQPLFDQARRYGAEHNLDVAALESDPEPRLPLPEIGPETTSS